MHDTEELIRSRRDLMVSPVVPIFDLEFADDTVIVACSAEFAEEALAALREVASTYGLSVNLDKTAVLSYKSEASIRYPDGTTVPRKAQALYLGSKVSGDGHSDAEVALRRSSAAAAFKKLKPIWSSREITQTKKLHIYVACVFSRLTHSMHTRWLTAGRLAKLESDHHKYLRRVARVPSTYASKILGQGEVVSNEKLRARL
eukprot:2139107-Alexandrium_andersonii.AAC.1